MIKLIPSTDSITIRSGDAADLDISALPVNFVVAPSGETENIVDDTVILTSSSEQVRKDLQIENLSGLNAGAVSYESLDNTKATVNSDGYVQSVGTGLVTIKVKSRLVDKAVHHLAETIVESSSRFDRYNTGTLGRQINDATDALATASQNKFVLSSTNPFTRNPNCWVTADKTCCPVSPRRGVLISPRHMVVAFHAKPGNGSMVVFLTNDNQQVSRTFVSFIKVGTFDLAIGVLNEDVPSSIKFSKVLPTDWQDYITMQEVPIICGDQELKLLVRDWYRYSEFGDHRRFLHRNSVSSVRVPLTETLIAGDSGSPNFVLINNELVVLACHFSAVSSPLITGYYDAVNAAMTTLGGNYQLTPIDLSTFPSFT